MNALEYARLASQLSVCSRRRVGAVVVNSEGWVVGSGCNSIFGDLKCPRERSSVPPYSGYDDPQSEGYCPATHAEVVALLQAGPRAAGSTVYVTDEPCYGCRKVLAAAFVDRVVWPEGQCEWKDLLS